MYKWCSFHSVKKNNYFFENENLFRLFFSFSVRFFFVCYQKRLWSTLFVCKLSLSAYLVDNFWGDTDAWALTLFILFHSLPMKHRPLSHMVPTVVFLGTR